MSSSPNYRVLDQFDMDDVIDVPSAPAALLAALRTVPDPRQRQGLRHELDGILTLVACAVVAGSRSFVAIAEWAEAATPYELGRLGILGEVPSESTIRRTLQRLDADGLDVILGAWAALYHVADPQQMQVIALDGKTLRGALADWAGSAGFAESVLTRAGIDPSARGEVLAVDDFARIAGALGELDAAEHE